MHDVDSYTHTVIGYLFDLPHRTTETKMRGCIHPESNDAHCAECGAKMWHHETDNVDPEDYLEPEAHDKLLKDVGFELNVIWLSVREDTHYQVALGLLVSSGADDDDGEVNFSEMPTVLPVAMVAAVKHAVETVGTIDMKDIGKFGIHSVTHVSY